MLGCVLAYVRSVLAGEVEGDPAVGRYLLDTFAASTDDLKKGGFNAIESSGNLIMCYFHLKRLTNRVYSGHTQVSWCRIWQTLSDPRPRFHPVSRWPQRPKTYVFSCTRCCLHNSTSARDEYLNACISYWIFWNAGGHVQIL